ncbi:MAG: RHS repeat-associated core domain-containing protein, partial [Azonexus sp.]
GFLQTFAHDKAGRLTETGLRSARQAQITRYGYTPQGQPGILIDALGRAIRLNVAPQATARNAGGKSANPSPGAAGRTLTDANPAPRTRYDDFGRPVLTRSPDTGDTRREFDAANRLIAMSDAAGHHARYEYDPQGRILKQTITDAAGKKEITQWRYAGRQLAEVSHPAQRERFEYDAQGRRSARIVTLVTEAGEHTAVTRYEHDDSGQLTVVTLPDGSRLDYRRNGQGQVVALTRNPVRTPWLRWLGGDQIIVRDLTRDLAGLAGYTTGNGIEARYQRSREGVLARIAYRHTRSRPTLAALPGIANAYAQTPEQTPAQPAASPTPTKRPGALDLPADPQALIDHRYLWDAQGNLLYSQQQAGQPGQTAHRSHAYDLRDRLVASVEAHGGKETAVWRYAYDRHQRRLLSQQTTAQSDLENNTRRTDYLPGTHRPANASYRDDGLPTRSGARQYEWNALGRLISVRDKDQEIARYRYDHRGLRNASAVGGQTTLALYDDARQPLAELDTQGRITRQYLYLADLPLALIDTPEGAALAPAEETPFARLTGDLRRILQSWFSADGIVWLHANHLGAPEAATDGNAKILWRADYAPFGAAVIHARDGFTLNLRLPGQYFDKETGLHYNRQRYYDPEQGQYLTPDPLGTPDGPNPYAYVAFNPFRYIDPDGLILFAFDGTGNSTDLNDPGMMGGGLSNVVYFQDAYNDGNKRYVSGVGTVHKDTEYGNIVPDDYAKGKLLDWLTGNDPLYVNDMGGNYSGPARIDRMMLYLSLEAKAFDDNQMMDIDIVGFSRGAAEAREFANRIVASSRQINGKTYYEYTDKNGEYACQWVNFRFIGLFDTVLSTNFSGTGYNLNIPPEFAYVAQAVALNEHRSGSINEFSYRNPREHSMHWGAFPLESIGASSNQPGQIRIELGFIGAHADIGGSYPDGEQGLSRVALHWMVEQAKLAGVTMKDAPAIPMDNPVVIHDQSNVILVGDPRTLVPRKVPNLDYPQTDYVYAEDREVRGAVSGN